jgi:hypothetical protein
MPSDNSKKRRRGSMFAEAIVAVTLVLMAVTAAAQLIAISLRQRRELEQLRIATNETANVMERLYSSPWNELADREADWPELSDAASDGLDEPRVRVSIETQRDMVLTKRCRVEITWIDQSGQRVEPIQLTAWKHSTEGP